MVRNKQNKKHKYKTKEESDMFSLKARAKITVKPGSKNPWNL